MKIKITYDKPSDDTLDLKDFGHDDKAWSDLSDHEKEEITDYLRDLIIVECTVEEIEDKCSHKWVKTKTPMVMKCKLCGERFSHF